MAQAKAETAPSNSISEFSTNGALIHEGSTLEMDKPQNSGEDEEEEEEEEVELAEEVDEEMMSEDTTEGDPNSINGIPAAIGPQETVKELDKPAKESQKERDKVDVETKAGSVGQLGPDKETSAEESPETPEKDPPDQTGLSATEPEPSPQSEPAREPELTQELEPSPEETQVLAQVHYTLCEQEKRVELEHQSQEGLQEKDTEEPLEQEVEVEKPEPLADEQRKEGEEENQPVGIEESTNEASSVCTDTEVVEKNGEKVQEEEEVILDVVEHIKDMQDVVQDKEFKRAKEQSTEAIVEQLAKGELAAVPEGETQPTGVTNDEVAQVDVVQPAETELIPSTEGETKTGPEATGPTGKNDEFVQDQVAATKESEEDEPDMVVEATEMDESLEIEEREEEESSPETDKGVPPQHTDAEEPEVPETTPVPHKPLPASDVPEPAVPETTPVPTEQLETPDAQEPEAPISTSPPPEQEPNPATEYTEDHVEKKEVEVVTEESGSMGLELLEEVEICWEVEEVEQEVTVKTTENELVEKVEYVATAQITNEEPVERVEQEENIKTNKDETSQKVEKEDTIKTAEEAPEQRVEEEETIKTAEEVPKQRVEEEETVKTSEEECMGEEEVHTDISEQPQSEQQPSVTEEDQAGALAEGAVREVEEPKQASPEDLPASVEGGQQEVEGPKEVTRDEPAPAERAAEEGGGSREEIEQPIRVMAGEQATTEGGVDKKEEPAQAADKQPTVDLEEVGRRKIEELKRAILKAKGESRRRSQLTELPQEDTVPSWVRARRKSEDHEHTGVPTEVNITTTDLATAPASASATAPAPAPPPPPPPAVSAPAPVTTTTATASSITSTTTTSIPFREKQVRFENGLPRPEIAVLTIRRSTLKLRQEANQNVTEKEKHKKRETEEEKEAPKKTVGMESSAPQEDEQDFSPDPQDYEISLYVKVSIHPAPHITQMDCVCVRKAI